MVKVFSGLSHSDYAYALFRFHSLAVFVTIQFDRRKQIEREVRRKSLINRSLVIKTVVAEDTENKNTRYKKEQPKSQNDEAKGTKDDGEIRIGDTNQTLHPLRLLKEILKSTPENSCRSKGSQIPYDNAKNENWECVICIEPFQVGEEVCWSRNPECDHAFHTKCLKPWLSEHVECPCCRKHYLVLKPAEASELSHKKSHQQQRDVENQSEQ